MLRLVLVSVSLSSDQVIAIIELVVNIIQALVLPITIYLLAVQTRAMRQQTTALLIQSKEMTEQTRVFTDTIYSATFQSLYDAEAHIGELMMTYPEASRLLMSQVPKGMEGEKSLSDAQIDPSIRERVSWLGTAMLDFFEHIWTQAQKRGLPEDTWESWEEYMGKIISETRLRLVWRMERGYYSSGFRRFVDLKVGLPPDLSAMPPLPRPQPENHVAPELTPPQVARVIRAVTKEMKNG
jgi:hypothetical protein